jgi:glyoxylase-like metal-dependent hydrolase (beta-lactamase superfamily II)
VSSGPHWSDPGAYPVADGVHRIPLPLPMDGLRAVNVYVLETADGLTCIDGGWAVAAAREQFEQSLRRIGRHPRDITSFLVTHAHRDHYTQAVALRTEFGRARVALGEGERPSLERIRAGQGEDGFVVQLRLTGLGELAPAWLDSVDREHDDPAWWQSPDTWLQGDHEIQVGERVLTAVETPGHTAGHFVFADLAAGVLFAGDHVLPTITPSIGFESVGGARPLGTFLESLVKVRALPDLRVLPAHGDTDARSHLRVAELLAHHEDRLSLCRNAVEAGHPSARAVAAELPWTRRRHRLADLDVPNTVLAVVETMFHLDLLAARKLVTREVVEGVARYQPRRTASSKV